MKVCVTRRHHITTRMNNLLNNWMNNCEQDVDLPEEKEDVTPDKAAQDVHQVHDL